MERKEVEAILFDLDGVLVDSIDAWFHVFNDTLKHFGFRTVTKKEFVKDFGAPIESDVKKYFKGKTIKEVERAYNLNFKKRKKHVKLFSQSAIILKKLQKYPIKIGLITNSTRFISSTILNHFKLKKYFSAVVTMNDVKKRKPAPDMILRACKILKVEPQNTILVGDTKNDMVAGRKAGCVVVGYKIKGDYRIDKLSYLLKLLQLK